jgi:hypothetical protein
LPIIEEIWSLSDIITKKTVAALCHTGIDAVLVKFRKDKAIVDGLDFADSDFYPSSNRRCESLFTTFKYNEKNFFAMHQLTLECSSKAKVNKLGDWLKNIEPEKRGIILKEAKRARYAIRKFKKEDEIEQRKFACVDIHCE